VARYDVPPTKSSLFAVRANLAIAREGHELLEQKREILVMELMRLVEKVRQLEIGVDAQVARAYGALKGTLARVGRQAAGDVADGIALAYETKEKGGRLMGIPLPSLDVRLPDLALPYSVLGSDGSCDATVREFFSLVSLLARMAEIRTMAWRLAREVRKTQRRVNALEKIVIPDILDTRYFIEGVLEEREREAFFVLKVLKGRLLADRT
jgi:V/A-type H+-transporting ATPase subunit D